MTLTGTLRRQFFGGEVWVLEPDDGPAVQLEGRIPAGLEGQRVKVEGGPAADDMGFGLMGPVIRVRRIAKA